MSSEKAIFSNYSDESKYNATNVTPTEKIEPIQKKEQEKEEIQDKFSLNILNAIVKDAAQHQMTYIKNDYQLAKILVLKKGTVKIKGIEDKITFFNLKQWLKEVKERANSMEKIILEERRKIRREKAWSEARRKFALLLILHAKPGISIQPIIQA